MSLCVMVFKKDGSLFIGADSRESAKTNGKVVVRNNHFEKIRKIHNKLIFASGNSSLVKNICDFYEKQNNDSLEVLKNIAIDGHNFFVNKLGTEEIAKNYVHNGELMTCCFTVGLIENDKPVIYYLASNNKFKIEKYEASSEVYISGATDMVSIDNICQLFKRLCLKDAYMESYSQYANEYIGGYLTVYKLDNKGISKFFKEKIKDSRLLKYENSLLDEVGGI